MTDFYHYDKVFDKSRPALNKEWTVLAAFVIENIETSEFKVVSLATGTKSVGRALMSKDGYVLNDCHAEVLAR